MGGALTARYDYVEYETGKRKLYNLYADPTELTNIYNSTSPTLISSLQAGRARGQRTRVGHFMQYGGGPLECYDS